MSHSQLKQYGRRAVHVEFTTSGGVSSISSANIPKSVYIVLDGSLCENMARRFQLETELQKIFDATSADSKLTVIRFDSGSQTLVSRIKSDVDFPRLWNDIKTRKNADTIRTYDAIVKTIRNIPYQEYKSHRIVIDVFTDGRDTASKFFRLDHVLEEINKNVIGQRKVHFHLYQFSEYCPLAQSLRSTADQYPSKCQIHPRHLFTDAISPSNNRGQRQSSLVSSSPLQDGNLNGKLRASPPSTIHNPSRSQNQPSQRQRSGIALLICNSFMGSQNLTCREHAWVDIKLVQSAFEQLTDRPVIVKTDVKDSQELNNHLRDFQAYIKKLLPEPDYSVVIISTHGAENDLLFMEDDSAVDLYQDIVYQFDNESFPNFDKPKLFFVQACRRTDSVEPLRKDGNQGQRSLDPAKFFVGSATLPYNYAYGYANQGSFYIRAICQGFKKGHHLEDMHQEVEKYVFVEAAKQNKRQVACTWKSYFPLDFQF